MQKMIERERAFYRDYKTQQRQPHYLALCLKKAPWRLPRRLTVKLVQSSRSTCTSSSSMNLRRVHRNTRLPPLSRLHGACHKVLIANITAAAHDHTSLIVIITHAHTETECLWPLLHGPEHVPATPVPFSARKFLLEATSCLTRAASLRRCREFARSIA